ncbi:hypothetical protein L3Q82_002601 [Scortum barcoo]|uniref:Uncharacterized protein n=1 Tax=Scortum barcoo TaxID=214431 RepID=A0ACB8VU05_9TELE|nr:hypothetical protein L3Q82_002601 [Scortum barcoo]
MPPGRLPREVFMACPTGRRPRGRPRTRWSDYVSQLAWERLGVPPEELEEVSGEQHMLRRIHVSKCDRANEKMAQWQVPYASRPTRAALGYWLHHGPGGLLHYSTAATAVAAAVAPDSSRSFCLSSEKVTMQELNARLALYLEQVQFLEAANQRLEHQIQMELDKKCPRELGELDGHLRTVSLLQDQISECLSSQAHVKLELLNAELIAFNLNIRCEKECERRSSLEAELRNLKMQEEELQVHRLPQLQNQLSDQTQQLMELQIQHQQDMQGLLAQVSGGITMEVQPNESLDLIQQLDQLRQTNKMLLNKKQNESWFSTQMSMLSSPEVTFDAPLGSEVIQAELKELRRTAANLEQELNQLQVLNMMLEASGQEQYESIFQQLVVLQQRADNLSTELESVLQTTAQQAEELQILLDIKSRLENEIQDYKRLLNELITQGVSSLHSNSAANITSYCVTTSPSTFRRHIEVDRTVRVQGGNLRMNHFKTISKGQIHTVRQTPVISPLSETVTTAQTIRVDSRTTSSPLTLINASNLTGSFDRSENQRIGALPEGTGRESMTIITTINKQSSPLEDKVQSGDHDLKNSSIISTQISQSLDKVATMATATTDPSKQNTEPVISTQMDCTEGSIQTKHQEMNTVQEIPTLAPYTQSSKSVTVEEKNEMFTSKQMTTEAGLQANEIGTKIQTEILKTVTSNSEPNKVMENADTGSGPVEDKVHAEDHDLQNTTIVSTQISQVLGKEVVLEASEPEMNTEQGIPTLVPDIQSASSAAVQEKTETLTSKQISTEASLQANETGINIQIEIAKTVLCPEPEVKQGPHIITTTTTTDPSQQTTAEVKTETEAVISAQMDGTEGSIQTNHQDPTQVVSVCLETTAEVVRDVGEAASTALSVVSVATASSSSPVSNDNLRSETASTEILKEVKFEVNEVKVLNGIHNTNEVKVDPDIVSLESQEASLSTTESKTSSTDSGVALSSSSNPETCLSPVHTEMSMVDQLFCPVDPEKDIRSPNSVLSPHDPEMFLSPHDSDTCLSPVEGNLCLSPNGGEEDEEVSLNLTEANAHVRPVEKYVLSTKEDSQSMSLSGQALPGEDRDKKVRESLYFGSSEPNRESHTLNGTNKSKSSSQGIGFQLSSSFGIVEFRGLGDHSIIANKEKNEQLGIGGLYGKSVIDAKYLRDWNKDTGGIADNKDVQNRGIIPGGKDGSQLHKETSIVEVRGQEKNQVSNRRGNSEKVFVKSASFGSVPANGGTTSTAVARNSEGKAGNSSVTLSGNAGAEGRFRHGSGEWIVYGGSLGRTGASLPSKESKENTSVATVLATSQQETGRFGSRGSGEWIVYGGNLRRKSSLDGGASLPKKGTEEGPSEVTNPPTNPPETGRFSSRGSGEWMCYGGSLGRKSSLPSAGNEKSQSVPTLTETSQPETKTFGRSGSGDWRVYGVSTGRMSRPARSDSLPGIESPSVATQLATSPPGISGFGRFGSEGSGEWRIYGGSTGSLNSASSADRVSVSAKAGQIISPPGSHTVLTTSQQETGRFGSRGSGEWIVYGGNLRRKSSLDGGASLPKKGTEEGPSEVTNPPTNPPETGRFSSRGSGEWMCYGGSLGCKSSLPSAGNEKSQSVPTLTETSQPETKTFGRSGSGDWRVYGGEYWTYEPSSSQ